ncbi:DUF1329 domain-containing protein [Acidocella sp.]|uniref:DUF1329 domain-containing protein n=1 Tax=Acidocella sp. TaxID=50710 RepID=UPI002608F6DE|nr:DUF1329 domain-containing protein [Acidocella sp.]
MRRRQFTALTGLSIAGATMPALRARALAPDAVLLKTKLTPLGAERAGNADGSIPAWTGGLTAPALPPTQPIDVPLFVDEAPLYTVDASNIAQHENLLTPGTLAMMQNFRFTINVYQTHRTVAAPQYVYDNTAANVSRARLDPTKGQNGFTGAYGGVPFPVIDTENPLTGGLQLVWNHLTSWRGYSRYTKFSPCYVVADGQLALAAASFNRFLYPYYDPEGKTAPYNRPWSTAIYEQPYHGFYSLAYSVSLQTNGDYQKLLPGAGHDMMIFLSSLPEQSDMAWLLPNDGCVGDRARRKRSEDVYAALNPTASKIAALDEYSCFYGAPAQYDWRFLGKREMLVPYNCNAMHFHAAEDVLHPKFPNPDIVRWEKHRVWVVEALLRKGESNLLAKRRLYVDEDSWLALLGEGYDNSGKMIKYWSVYNRCIPSLPATCILGSLVFDLESENYVFDGSVKARNNAADEFSGPQQSGYFVPWRYAFTACDPV